MANINDLEQQDLKMRQQWQKRNNRTGVLVNCSNCEHRDRENDQCGKFDIKPPIDVIVIGCDHWILEIPF